MRATLADAVSLHEETDRKRLDSELNSILGTPSGSGRVLDAMRYAVLGRGQRLRPLLALRIARLAGAEGILELRAAAAVELVHCASLIVDDLPCMDNEQTRRGQPTTHVQFGEPTALLAAFGLVALAARSVVDVTCQPVQMSGLIDFQVHLLRVLDAGSLIEGQDLDLRLTGDERDHRRSQVNELKTVPLFELSARAGLLFTDPDSMLAKRMRRFAREFGRAYQAVDDYLDGESIHLAEVNEYLQRAHAWLEPFQPAAGELTGMVEHLQRTARAFNR